MWKALPPLLLFLSFDLPFFGANLLKFWDGGWIPIVVAAAMLVIMVDWKVGRRVLNERITEQSPPLKDFLAELERYCPLRIPGAAIFLASNPEWTPPVLFTHARRIRALREKLVLLTVTTEHVPYVDREDRLSVEDLGKGVFRVIARAGFMETPNVPRLLAEAKLPIDLEDATYFLGRETFLAGKGGKMGVFSEGLFAFLSRNARSATSWFGIPPDQVVELGMQLDL
jgi:KUP system potassium uptake protein